MRSFLVKIDIPFSSHFYLLSISEGKHDLMLNPIKAARIVLTKKGQQRLFQLTNGKGNLGGFSVLPKMTYLVPFHVIANPYLN